MLPENWSIPMGSIMGVPMRYGPPPHPVAKLNPNLGGLDELSCFAYFFASFLRLSSSCYVETYEFPG